MKPLEKFCELWEHARAVDIVEETGGYRIKLERDGQEIKARFVVGAHTKRFTMLHWLTNQAKVTVKGGENEC